MRASASRRTMDINGTGAKAVREILLWTATHRLLVLGVSVVAAASQRSFDTSSHLLFDLDAYGDVGRWRITMRNLAGVLLRWDVVHFLGIASPRRLPTSSPRSRPGVGLSAEHHFAFQPGIIMTLRACLSQWLWSWPAHNALSTSILVTAIVSMTSPVLLYIVTQRLTDDRVASKCAALLSIFAFSPSTLLLPTPEPFFSFSALLGHIFVSYSETAARPHGFTSLIIAAALAFGSATAFRANGILLAGFLLWRMRWTHTQTAGRVPAVHMAILMTSIMPLAILPFMISQVWSYWRFCDDRVGQAQRPWCSRGIPSIYNFVQETYWDVGYLKYWRWDQLPNWVLASPVLLLALKCCYQVYSLDLVASLTMTFDPLLRLAPKNGRFKVPAASSRLEQQIGHHQIAKRSNLSRLLPFAHYTAVLSSVLILSSHVQIALRFGTAGAMPTVWWALSDIVMAQRDFKKAGDPNQAGKNLKGVILRLLLCWNFISLTLYAGFYPPA